MIAKRLFKLIFTITLGAFSVFSYGQSGPATKAPTAAMPDLNISPDQMQKMDTMMHEMQHFYDNLSTEEKAQFEKELASEVAKEQEKLEKMAPAAQKQYIETAFKAFDDIDIDDLIEQLGDAEADTPQNTINNDKPSEKAAEKSKESEKAENKKKIKDTLDLINNIIKVLNSLNTKLNSIKPSVQDVVDKWIQKGYIQGTSNWKTFNHDLQTMKQRLEKVKQADPSTGKYYYLDNVKTIEKLYGQLEMLYSTIKKYEPSVEITAAGTVKNEAAKSALTKLINSLADTTKTITKSIDEIVGKFVKTEAPKLKQKEDEKAKKASSSSKKVPRGKTTSVGTTEKEEAYSAYSPDSAPSYYGPTYSSGNSYGSSSGDRPDYGLTTASNSPSSGSMGSSKTPGTSGLGTPGIGTGLPGAEKKKDDLLVNAPIDQKKKLEEQELADNALEKQLKSAHTGINNFLDRTIADNIDTFSENYDTLAKTVAKDKDQVDWSDTKLLPYLKGAAKDDEFAKEITDLSEKAVKAYDSVAEFVERVNDKVTQANLKTAFRDKGLKMLKDHDKTEKAITEKLKMIETHTEYGKLVKDADKKKLYDAIMDFRSLSKIRTKLNEIK